MGKGQFRLSFFHFISNRRDEKIGGSMSVSVTSVTVSFEGKQKILSGLGLGNLTYSQKKLLMEKQPSEKKEEPDGKK